MSSVCVTASLTHVGVASLCRTCPVSQGSGGGVLANEEEEHRAIEKRSIEQRSKPDKSTPAMLQTSRPPVLVAQQCCFGPKGFGLQSTLV